MEPIASIMRTSFVRCEKSKMIPNRIPRYMITRVHVNEIFKNLDTNGIIILKSIKNPMMKNNVCVASSMTKSRCAPHVEFYHSIFCEDIVSLSCALHGAVFKYVLFS